MIAANSHNQPTFASASYATLEPDPIMQVLNGQAALAVFPGYARAEDCAAIMHSFMNSPSTRQRTGDATGYYLGAFHWGKDLSYYANECESIKSAVDKVLYDSLSHPWQRFIEILGLGLTQVGATARPANVNDVQVSTPIIRSWTGEGEYSLVPHEDKAQCFDPQQSAFEIQQVASHAVCSVNMCIRNDGGGDLVMWNYQPSVADRNEFGTSITGGPYPTQILEPYPKLTIKVNKGDLYIFNGALVHAVSPTVGVRATVSSLLGFVDDHTVALWT